MRALYGLVVWLHPASFKDEFGSEMRWIFDEAHSSGGAVALFSDAVASLARQWLLRSDLWKFGVGALLTAGLFAGMIGPAASRLVH